MSNTTAFPARSFEETATIPSIIVSSFFEGSTPGFVRLSSLSAYAQSQYEYYASTGVMTPLIGPYEALGRAFAETASFKIKYGMDAQFFSKFSYIDVFGSNPTAQQIQHFDSQISYFSSLYIGAGMPREKSDILAKGAVLGQMLGHAAIDRGSALDYYAAAKNYIAQIDSPSFEPGPLPSFAGISLSGTASNDVLVGGDGHDRLYGLDGDDRLTGGAGNDGFNGGRGNDTFNGGAGTDFVFYDRDFGMERKLGVTINLDMGDPTDDLGIAINGSGDTDNLISIEEARGTRFDDYFIGDNKNNFLKGFEGDDTMFGGDGVDTMRPGSGNDHFDGGGSGSNIDLIDYADAPRGLTATLGPNGTGAIIDPWGGTDTYVGVEGLNGTLFADRLTGNEQNNRLRGHAGNDILDGAGGIDIIDYRREGFFGGTLGVKVNLSLNTGSDTFGDTDTLLNIENVFGSPFNDIIIGSRGANELRGDEGNDILDGLGGSDLLRGDAGDDIFVYKAGYGATTIADLAAGGGSADKVDLRSFGVASYAELSVRMTATGGNVQINFDKGDILTLLGLSITQLSPSDFLL